MTNEELKDAGYERACGAGEVGGPLPKAVTVGDRNILLCKDGEAYFAVDELCPHENQPMKFGVVFQGEITCPHHQYRFKLDTGACTRRCAPLETFEVAVLDDDLWVRVNR